MNHLKQLVIDFKKRPSPYDASTLSSWLKIRDILEREKAREGGDAASYVWYQEDWLRFLEVYPHLKAAVRNLEVEMQKASQGVDVGYLLLQAARTDNMSFYPIGQPSRPASRPSYDSKIKTGRTEGGEC